MRSPLRAKQNDMAKQSARSTSRPPLPIPVASHLEDGNQAGLAQPRQKQRRTGRHRTWLVLLAGLGLLILSCACASALAFRALSPSAACENPATGPAQPGTTARTLTSGVRLAWIRLKGQRPGAGIRLEPNCRRREPARCLPGGHIVPTTLERRRSISRPGR
jgi:hypothetical protein